MSDMEALPTPSRHLLDDGRRTRAMVWIMAIMIFLTVLAAALGLGAARSAGSLDRELAGRLTVQIIGADKDAQQASVAKVVAALRKDPAVTRVAPVDRARLAKLLKPWLGDAGLDPDLPMPAMIDVDLRHGDTADVARVTAQVQAIVPGAQVDRHARWLAPVRGFITTLWLLGAGLVALMAVATTAVVLLAARSGLDTHRDTIDVLHMLGSTDVQVARLFQRRIALDTLTGGAIGAVGALALTAFFQARLAMLGSQMMNTMVLTPADWAILVAVPFAFALMAMAAARLSVVRTLKSQL